LVQGELPHTWLPRLFGEGFLGNTRRQERTTSAKKKKLTTAALNERRGVALGSVSESLDTATAAGRLVLNIMSSVSQGTAKPASLPATRAPAQKGERIQDG
jgi:hypothetical protein